MLKINKNQQRLPIGGHHYPCYGIMFRGDSVDEVATKLKEFRLNNNTPVGNPTQDVLLFYAIHFPYMVIWDESDEPEDSEDENYKSWRRWVYETWANPPIKTVSYKEASMRWDACLKCPFNQPKDWGDSEESRELARRVFLLRRGVDIPREIGFCSCFKADISVFSFLHDDSIPKDKESPSNCWTHHLSG